MAINLDTRLPLMAVGEQLMPQLQQSMQMAQQYRQNELQQRLAELKASREADMLARRERASKSAFGAIQGIQSGRPAEYETISAPMRQGPYMNQPKYGETMQREVSPAVQGREVTPQDYQRELANALFREGDYEGAFEAMKGMRQDQQMRSYGADFKVGKGGEYYAPNLQTGRLEPTGVYAREDMKGPQVKLVGTARGIEAVDMSTIKPGTVLPAPEKERKPDVTPYQRIQIEGGLRDDYRTDSKNYAEIKRQHGIIKAALNDPSAAATLSAATAYMKMLDPGSVVRESELGMAMNTQGAIDRLQSYWTTIEQGKTLTAQQKADFSRLSDLYLKAAEQAQSAIDAKYRDIASGYGLNPERIIMNKPTQQSAPRSIEKAKLWLKSQKIQTQQQFNAAVQQLKKSGWTDQEIRSAAEGM